MSLWIPCKRIVFVRRLRKIGFAGPYSESRHEFMVFQNNRMAIPSNKEYSVPQLKMMIKEFELIIGREIDSNEWNNY